MTMRVYYHVTQPKDKLQITPLNSRQEVRQAIDSTGGFSANYERDGVSIIFLLDRQTVDGEKFAQWIYEADQKDDLGLEKPSYIESVDETKH